MTQKQSKAEDTASSVIAVVMALVALAVIVFAVIHIGSILKVLLCIGVGFMQAIVMLLCWSKGLKRFGEKPWVNNKWTWLTVLVLSGALIWFRGTNALYLVSTVLFLLFFITPVKPKPTANETPKSN